jgi:hypothetical protein
MPMVPALLQRITGIVPDRTVNPDEAVARGAAIYAHYLLSSPQQGGAGATFQVTNVTSHSLGVEGIDADTLRKVNVILIPRNTPLPAQVTERFATKSPDQRSIVIQVLEGESSSPGECAPIGRTVIRDLPAGLPKGWPVEVTFAYGTNGRLSVRGVVPGTDRAVMLDMERDVGLSPDGVARLQEAVGSAAGFDEFDAMLQEVLGTPADGPPGKEPPASRPSSVAIVSQPTPLSGGGGWKPAAGAGESEVGSRPSEVGKRQPAVGGEHSASREQTGGSPQSAAPVVFQSLESPGAGHASLAEAAAPGPKRQPPSAGHSAGHSARRWVVSVVGYAVSAAAGIALAYYLVSWLLPGAKLPKLW